jgi:signal transduction histidine kinase
MVANETTLTGKARALPNLHPLLLITIAIGMLLFMVLAGIYQSTAAIGKAQDWVQHTYVVITTIDQYKSALQDAETGQRGYILTGEPPYLEPYRRALEAIPRLQGDLQRLTADDPRQQERLPEAGRVVQEKLSELARTIALRDSEGREAAIKVVATETGKQLMDRFRSIVASLGEEEQQLLQTRLSAAERSEEGTRHLVQVGVAVALGLLLTGGHMLREMKSLRDKADAERERIARRLAISFESLSQGIAVFDSQRRLVLWNDRCVDAFDFPPNLMQLGTPYGRFVEYFSEKARAGPFLETEEQIARSERRDHEKPEMIVYERDSGGGRRFEIRRTVIAAHQGFVLTLTDMTARVQAEAMARSAQNLQALGKLTGGIAHDFNNLLLALSGNIEFARSRLGDGHPALPFLDRSFRVVERAATLMKQLLAFARRQPLSPRPVNIARLLPDIVELIKRTIAENIDVRVVEGAGLWPALADPGQVENALLNLVLNARDAMPNGGQLAIEVANAVLDETYARAHPEVRPGEYVLLAVTDTGTGIPQEILDKVFDPFFTTKGVGKGTGLGLSMIFGFARQSGGHVKIYSEVGEGTTVKLYLPRAIGMKAVPISSSPAGNLPLGQGQVILLVEDDVDARMITVEQLRDLGYHVLDAADGKSALQVLQEAECVDLLLTDVVLPGKLSGRTLAETIIAQRPAIKVLYVSGYSENAIVHHGRLDEGVELLSKPFTRDRLAHKVASMLGAGPKIFDGMS